MHTSAHSKTDLTIRSGSKIAIIGAGPAGSFFAHFAHRYAADKDIKIDIVLFDGKDFTTYGPKGCNLCAGVISETLLDRLISCGIALPKEKVQRRITGYNIIGKAGEIHLTNPKGGGRITTVYRGNGPRRSSLEENVSFDDYLLENVRKKGIRIINSPVREIVLPSDLRNPITIIYGTGADRSAFEADLAVGAFGLNPSMTKYIQELDFGYIPPKTVRAWNMEIRADEYLGNRDNKNSIRSYNLSDRRGISVINIVPKKEYVTVNMIGKKDVRKRDFDRVMSRLVYDHRIPKEWREYSELCSCSPKVVTSSARTPYTDRLVLIGDASCSRYYKNGIESALITAKYAAKAVFELGISNRMLRKGYYRRIKRSIVRDNLYGRILVVINDIVTGNFFLSKIMNEIARPGSYYGAGLFLRDVLWNMYTGNTSYKRIFISILNPVQQTKVIIGAARAILRNGYRSYTDNRMKLSRTNS